MEIALEPGIPTYSGGLGGLAGDTVRSAADLGISMVAVSLLHRRGYFRQRLDPAGQQDEEPDCWEPEKHLEPLEPRVELEIGGRQVTVAAWRYTVRGISGDEVPVVMLDSDLPENHPEDRRLTDTLYGGDSRYRLCQEAILGIGGVRMLWALGHASIHRFHLNEGHAALAVLALLDERVGGRDAGEKEILTAFEDLRSRLVFTTHTPVAAGHDQFSAEVASFVLGERRTRRLAWLGQKDKVNLTELALSAAHFVNGVAMRHGEVSRDMFPHYPIHSITNGIHPATWASPPFRDLFDRFAPKWRHDAFALRYAVSIPIHEIARAHRTAKQVLLDRVNEISGAGFRKQTLTIGFARRATAYKRATLVFHDVERLVSIAREAGPLQLVFAGKAHPADWEGKALIRRVFEARKALKDHVAVAYLPDYGMELARLLVAGCDVWLNTPVPPLEASGTSGMKAALNGVPSLSVLDGWWIEGHVEGVTGWSIGRDQGRFVETSAEGDAEHAQALYDKLEFTVIPTYYGRQDRFLAMMRHAIALNASFFNSQRMVLQYLYDAY
ncbi:MAG: alpha-glucan family phosphorylase [Deltaproteobacteria bacterium]|nr:alpha-glucan family phosphorylase [Deltaproteobacteria bacterium]